MKKIIKEPINHITGLIKYLSTEELVYLQVHNFPDPDAVASAFALQYLFSRFGIASRIVYDCKILGAQLQNMVRDLGIELHYIKTDRQMGNHHKIVLVDGCKGNANVTDLIGDEVGIIDHHRVSCPEDIEFVDIRPDYGSCSSIIGYYFQELGIDIPRKTATALMIGIGTDTALLTRGASKWDLEIYFRCFRLADIDYVMNVLRNPIHYNDLHYYDYLIKHMRVIDNLAFCHFPEGCEQTLLAILASFALSPVEIELVVLCATTGRNVHFSVRNEKKDWSASFLIQELLNGIGFGGGHHHMAGGVIDDVELFKEKDIFNNILKILNIST